MWFEKSVLFHKFLTTILFFVGTRASPGFPHKSQKTALPSKMSENGTPEKRVKMDEPSAPESVKAAGVKVFGPGNPLHDLMESTVAEFTGTNDDEFNAFMDQVKKKIDELKRPQPDSTPATQVIPEEEEEAKEVAKEVA